MNERQAARTTMGTDRTGVGESIPDAYRVSAVGDKKAGRVRCPTPEVLADLVDSELRGVHPRASHVRIVQHLLQCSACVDRFEVLKLATGTGLRAISRAVNTAVALPSDR
jgi:hypothetical protein